MSASEIIWLGFLASLLAVALWAIDYTPWQSFWLAFCTGLVEPVGGLFGSAAVIRNWRRSPCSAVSAS